MELVSVWVGAQARSDSNNPADILGTVFSSIRRPGGHPLDAHRSDEELIGACLKQARRCLVRRPTGAGHPNPIQRRDDSDQFGTEHHRGGRYTPRRPRSCGFGRTRGSPRCRELRHDRERLQEVAGVARRLRPRELVGVEGTGSYRAGLTRHLQADRSASSKSTVPITSAAAARAVLPPRRRLGYPATLSGDTFQ